MQENYLISIVGTQFVDDEKNEIRLETLGSYVIKEGKQYIVYKEYNEDDPNKYRTSVLKIENNRRVTLMRSGDATRLILEQGKRHLCQYGTEFGSIMLGVFASCVDSSLVETGGNLHIQYTLDVNSNLSSRNEININVKEAAN